MPRRRTGVRGGARTPMQRTVDKTTGVSRQDTANARLSNNLRDLRDRMNQESGGNNYFVRRDLSGIGRYRAGGMGGHGSP